MACSEAEEPTATTSAPAPDGTPAAPLMDGKHRDQSAADADDGEEDDSSAGDSDGKVSREASSGNEEDSDGGRPASWSGDGDSDSSVGDAVCGRGKDLGPCEERLLAPLSHLPQPEAPPGLTNSVSDGGEDFRPMERSLSENAAPIDVSAIGKYLRDRGSTLSAAFARRISSLKEQPDDDVTEFNLSGLRVIVRPKAASESEGSIALKGRISFFSRSNCRDCTAVRSFFREKGLPYVEINVDVFPAREKDLIARAGSASVPQVFFNEKLVGGLVVLNSLRNSGEFDRRLREMAGRRCPESAPQVPVYGFDDEEVEGKDKEWGADAMVGIVRVLRQRLPIQDRLSKMKIVKNCFAGRDLVEAVINHLDCGRRKAVEIGKELCRKRFIHHVFRERDFEDGNHLYRFLEHDPLIPRCFNFRGATNDDEPEPASAVGRRLTKLMWAMLEAYASVDRRHVDYARISASEEFRRYVNVVEDLQRVDVFVLSDDERMAFFLNVHNAMAIHAVIRMGRPEGVIDRRAFHGDFHYIVGGYPYSLSTIKNGILRSNRRPPYSFVKPFSGSDKRLQFALPKLNPLIHFGLCNGSRSSPAVRFFSGQGTELELRNAAREFFLGGGLEVDLEKRSVHLSRIIKWYSVDFEEEKEFLKWVIPYLDASKAGLLTHVLRDGGPLAVVYQNFDWSANS